MYICIKVQGKKYDIVDTISGSMNSFTQKQLLELKPTLTNILGLKYKDKSVIINNKVLTETKKGVFVLDLINPHNNCKGAELIIYRHKGENIIRAVSTKDGKEQFKTKNSKYINATNLDISYVSQASNGYLVTFKYDTEKEIISFVDGKQSNKLNVGTNLNDCTQKQTKGFTKESASNYLGNHDIKNVEYVGTKPLDKLQGFEFKCKDDGKQYWVLENGKIFKQRVFADCVNYKLFYKPEELKDEPLMDTKALRNLILDYCKASAMLEPEARYMEKALCNKLKIQSILSVVAKTANYVDMIVLIDDNQTNIRLSLGTGTYKII